MRHQILCSTVPLTNARRLLLYRRRLDAWKLNQWFKLSSAPDSAWLPEKVSHLLLPQAH
jgi:hypothetical protein